MCLCMLFGLLDVGQCSIMFVEDIFLYSLILSLVSYKFISYQPTGRAIQVEGGYGDRLPSIDTRPPRIRDSDAIIEVFDDFVI